MTAKMEKEELEEEKSNKPFGTSPYLVHSRILLLRS